RPIPPRRVRRRARLRGLTRARSSRYRAAARRAPRRPLPVATPKKFCFMNKERPCDLTCKAAFEVDDPVDNIDCYFIWLSHHFGEGLFEVRRILETMGGPGAAGGG